MLQIASDDCYPPFCMFIQHRILCSIIVRFTVLYNNFITAYSAYHLTEIEENIYKICHIKCVSEFLHYK